MTDQELHTIRQNLRAISDLIGPGPAYNSLMDDPSEAVPISMAIEQLIAILPPAHRPTYSYRWRGQKVVLRIPKLFDRLEDDGLRLTLGFVASQLPLDFLYVQPSERDRTIILPTQIINDALWSFDDGEERVSKQDGIPDSRWCL